MKVSDERKVALLCGLITSGKRGMIEAIKVTLM